MNFFTLIVACVLSTVMAVPYIHKSVKAELNKGAEAVLMVTFEQASLEGAYDPETVLNAMKQRKHVSTDISSADFTRTKLYDEFRGFYVYYQVAEKHAATKKLLRTITPRNSIITSVPISNLFLLRNLPGLFDTLKDCSDVIEINTNQKFLVNIEKSTAHQPELMKKGRNLERAGLKMLKKYFKASDSAPEPQWNVKRVGAEEVWAQGGKGEGLIYGIADTGMSYSHPVLIQSYRGLKDGNKFDHNYSWWDGVREKVPSAPISKCPVAGRIPCDDQGHGTHCVSTAVGGSGYGVAPGAKWVGCRNMDAGLGSTVTYLNCLNFFLAPHDLEGKNPRPDLRPHVVGNSYGCPDYEGCSLNAMTSAVNALRAAGIFMSVSAGNEGPGCSTITFPPAIEPQVITVGAVDMNEVLAPFSSRGPVTIGGKTYRKPDLVAPGVGIMGAHLNNGFRRLSGTSMASPHVSGAALLMISNCPCLARDVDRIQSILESTAKKLYPNASLLRNGKYCGTDGPTTYPNNYFGYGRIDVAQAVRVCQQFCAERVEASFGAEGEPVRLIPEIVEDSSLI